MHWFCSYCLPYWRKLSLADGNNGQLIKWISILM